MAKLFPLILAALGLAIGAGAGYALKPATDNNTPTKATDTHDSASVSAPTAEPVAPDNVEYVKLNNQFVVPVMEQDRVTALVVLSLSLEVTLGERETVYQVEPKLRDAFLQVMFDHANAGGFKGVFTKSTNMSALRMALLETAQKILGPKVSDVLIIDMVRQDT